MGEWSEWEVFVAEDGETSIAMKADPIADAKAEIARLTAENKRLREIVEFAWPGALRYLDEHQPNSGGA